MKNLSRLVFAVVLAAQAGSLLAADVLGTWKGKVTLDASKMPKASNPEGQKAMEQGLSVVKKMVIILKLNGNKTYTAEAQNVPGKEGTQKSEGTWKQEGTTLWLTGTKDNGKPKADKKPQKFLILENGKKLSVASPDMPPFVKVTFTR